MIRIPCQLALATIVALVCSSGCDRGKAASASDQTSAAQRGAAPATGAQQGPSRPKKNACALVNLAEIEAIATKKLAMLHNIEADDQSACELSDASNTTLVTVTVHWTGGKELARINQSAMSMARQLLNDDDVNIEEITGSKKVRGIADKAYYSDVMPSWVLKNDVLIEMISPLFSHAQTKAVFLSVSKSALPQL